MLLVCMVMGAFAAIAVYVGDLLEVPHFNRRAGYIGTEFIRSFLYAINDPYAIHIVACLWFFYGSLATGTIVFTYRVLFLRRYSKSA